VARKTVNSRRLGTFIPLGERILGEDDLQEIGVATGGVVRILYGINSDEGAERFEAFCANHAGRRVAFIKDGQVVNLAKLNDEFSTSGFLSSKY
jgi:preprotein translocase subunit SecD